MGNEDQALTVHTKKIRKDYHHPKGKHSHQKHNPKRYSRDLSKSDAIHVTREDTFPESILETKVALTRRRESKEDIMHTLQKMMNLPERESNKKVNTFQVMKNMF